MTTDTTHANRRTPVAPLLGAVVVVSAVGLVLVVVAALTGGSDAAAGVAVGSGLALAVFAFGAFAVNAVAGAMPSAALMVALMTYFLQVLALALALTVLNDSAAIDRSVDRTWLAGGVIACTLVWLAAQVRFTARLRTLAYDLPDARRHEAGA
ncbi:hypothetical protein I601_3932 [Nocardioides dokdonensis FR1436]|uniref:ATP synthase protein I n=1 Tax=Nocardioides dokdonensis FR1436 TaxID=1300347 RepID=A0A1A9GRN7_9ACTN|nr:hypothetical protein [Nocardioides dokdonensis]ANH40330.1 hypothetical protein I601_3932 [Nocardioides dokdonensis FR1436]